MAIEVSAVRFGVIRNERSSRFFRPLLIQLGGPRRVSAGEDVAVDNALPID
jgi:hypothetical protein